MIVPLFLFSVVGLGIFCLQNLVFFPHVHLRLLALLLFYVALRPSLSLALSLALVLGLLQDGYATTPFGLHLGASLVLVAVGRFYRRRILLSRLLSQVSACLVALILQEGYFQASTFILGYQNFFLKDLSSVHGLEIAGTAVLGPLMNLWVGGIERFLRRCGWGRRGEPAISGLFHD